MNLIRKFLFIFVFFSSMNVSAWWDTGHRMVCDQAYELLTLSAITAIDPLIEEHGSFGQACLWADWIKGDRKDTRSWHYINLPDEEQNTYKAECPKNGCLFSAFYKQMDILQDSSVPFSQREEALWFIGHFVGDVHQPMHVGFPEDRGGNGHMLTFSNGTKTNMHKIWDGQIIEHMELLYGKDYLLNQVIQKINKLSQNVHSEEIESWAQESRNIAMQESVGYRNNALEVATDKYMESHFDIIQERIALGAIRLSQILNRLYQENN